MNTEYIKSKIDFYNNLDYDKKIPSEIFKSFITKYKELDEKEDALSEQLNSFSKSEFGLVPDNIRASSEFKKASYDFAIASNETKQFIKENKKIVDFYNKNFKYILKKNINLDLIKDDNKIENLPHNFVDDSIVKKTRKMR